MQWFWLVLTIVIVTYTTFKVITEDFRQWGTFYIFAAITLFFYFIRRFMMKRMEKHQAYLNQKSDNKD